MSLRERRELVALCRGAETREGAALISLVQVAGSSYRRPGARLLVLRDGRSAGTLSGGCLEADLLRRAGWTVREGAVIEHVSTAFDDTADIPYGLGCGGEVDLLLEPLDAPEAGALMDALEATLHGHARTVATLLPAGASRTVLRMVMDPSGDVLFASDALPTEDVVEFRAIVQSMPAQACAVLPARFGTLHVEMLLPAQRLVIFGAGEDARPLARLAAEMGWTVAVVDTRSQRATVDRFPTAQQVLVAAAASYVPVRADDAVVLMTHSYEQDLRLLTELLPISPRYLGLLGARHRSALLLQQSSTAAGLTLTSAVDRVHGPIGLELGGDGPEAVALAIVAELQQALAAEQDGVRARRLSLDEAERLLAHTPALPAAEACGLYAQPARAVTH